MSDSAKASSEMTSTEGPRYHVFCAKPQPVGRLASNGSIRQYSTRKSHTKTKSGCTMCKVKRVKCDEQRPVCARCRRNATECSFASKTSPTPSLEDEGISTSTSLVTQAPQHLVVASRSGVVPRPLIRSSKDLHLLKHYDTLSSNELLIGPETDAYRDAVLQLAQSHSYLFHAMLAIAASHLTDSNVDGYQQAKLGHLSLALQHFQKAISKTIRKEESDALLLTSIMINVQYFHGVEDLASEDDLVESDKAERLSWLLVQEGCTALIAKTRPFHKDTRVLHYFYVKPLQGDHLRRLPQAMFDLCNVTDEMGFPGVHQNPYHDAVHALALLMPWEPGSRNFIKYMHFCGRVYKPFVALVEQNDHRALLILAWWFALLGSVNMWWSRRRVRRDCRAICAFLDGHSTSNIRDLLGFPAEVCRYTLRDKITAMDGASSWQETDDLLRTQ